MKQILVLILFLSTLQFGLAQEIIKSEKIENIEVTSTTAEFLGKVGPVRDIIDAPLSSDREKKDFKKNRKKPDNFKNRLDRVKVVRPELEHQGIDPVWQSTHSTLRSSAGTEPIVNIVGLGQGSPTDPTGSIGQDYYLQAVNGTDVGVWDKEGNNVTQFDMENLWDDINFNSAGDPIILYDQENSRWIITEFAPQGVNSLLIAVSETSDPLGSYYSYAFSTPTFPDYPKYSIWSNHLVVTTNESGPGTLHQYFIEREALLTGQDARIQRVAIDGALNAEQNFIVSTPVDWEGTTRPDDDRPIIIKLNDSSWGEVANDAIELFRFDIDYDNENNTQVESLLIETSPYDGFPCWPGPGFACCPQPGGVPLDGIPEVIMNAPQYRNFGTHEAMVLSFVTDVTDGENHAGVRWMEMRREPGVDWYLYQEGSYAPDGNHRYMSGIGIDRKGNIALAYNISSDSVFAGIRYTGRFANDPLGQMTLPEVTAISGNSTLNTGGRFADYSHISVDPVDETTFWFTSEFAFGGTSRTRIVSWQMSQDTFDMAIRGITSPSQDFDLTASEPIEIEVANNGIETAMAYEVSYSVEGVEMETMVINDPLTSGSTRSHTFNVTQDFSAFGEYNVSARVDFVPDENPNNNETSKTVVNRPPVDISLEVNGDPIICSIFSLINIQITNNGGQDLTEASIDISLDGSVVDTYTWEGDLSFGQSEDFNYLLTGIPDGENNYSFTANSSGGGADFNFADNVSDYQLTSIGGDGFVVLNLIFDFYSSETDWTITEEGTNNVVAQGGNYPDNQPDLTEEICLEPDACYVFTISDSFGDGIDDGGFELTNSQNEVIASFFDDWGQSYSVDFCPAEIECSISLTAEVQDEIMDGTLGSIMITAGGGQGPFTYSIDGGVTFQESNIFDGLSNGSYLILVAAADESCTETINVIIDLITSIDDLDDVALISATPNPNIGFFDLSVKNYVSTNHFLSFEVLDAQGKIVQSSRMGKFSGTYMTEVSLLNYPDGIYFIRILDPNIKQLVKIIKAN